MFNKLDKFIESKILNYIGYECNTCYNKISYINQLLNCIFLKNKIYCCKECFNHI